jgi:hypothetical protein
MVQLTIKKEIKVSTYNELLSSLHNVKWCTMIKHKEMCVTKED